MALQEKKSGRGGRRNGAGRRKGTSKLYAFRADKKVAAYIDSRSNKTEFIRDCILRRMEADQSAQSDVFLRQLGEVAEFPSSEADDFVLF